MNWSKAKTIMILFLLMTNIFLITILADSYIKRYRVSPEIIDAAVSLLQSRGIMVSPDLIPTKISSEKLYTVENVISDYETFASLVLGDSAIVSSEFSFSNEISTLSFSGDNFNLDFPSGLAVNGQSPQESVTEYLKTLNINVSSAELFEDYDENGGINITFIQNISGKPFFDCRVNIYYLNGKILSVNGCWFNKVENSVTATSMLQSVPATLVKFSSQNTDITDTKITSIKLGYAINEKGVFHKQATVLPVYEITTSSNETYYIDAREN